MSIKTRKHMRAVSLVMSIAIVGVLAAFLVLAANPGPTQAQDDRCATASGDALELLRQLGLCTADTADTSDAAQDAECATASGDALEVLRQLGLCGAGGGGISSDSTSGGSAPEFKVVIDSLPAAGLAVGSSIVLYLEDDYQEPATIPASSVYFVAEPASASTGHWNCCDSLDYALPTLPTLRMRLRTPSAPLPPEMHWKCCDSLDYVGLVAAELAPTAPVVVPLPNSRW
jgi:hypothetical protein